MAIKNGDLKIYKAERMTQFEDGGGKITGLELQNNKSNEVFDDVTNIDRVVGKLEVAKVFPAVKSYGDPMLDAEGNEITGADGKVIIVPETLQAANLIITKNPEDKYISALAFTTGSYTDEVVNAKDRIASHLTKTIRISGELMGRQLKGSKKIRFVAQPKASFPGAGSTIYIVENESTPSEVSQYLKVESVESKVQEVMTIMSGEFKPMMLNVIDYTLYYPLDHDFDGGEITGSDTASNKAFLRETQVNDAMNYRGCVSLEEETNIGDLRTKVSTVYGQLVPPSESQVNIVDVNAGSDASPIVASGGVASFVTNEEIAPNKRIFCQVGIMPNTLKVNYSGGVLTDIGGQIMNGDLVVGYINYHTGVLTFSITAPTIAGGKTITYSVAGAPTQVAQTERIRVAESNRSDTYNINLFPSPEPGSVSVDYIAMGNRYRLKDRGDGVLEGIEDVGVGTVDYRTGSVSVTFKELADANTSVMFTFGTKIDYMNRGQDYLDGKIPVELMKPKVKKQLEGTHILRGSLKLSWLEEGKSVTAKDDSNGIIIGGTGGTIDYVNGILELVFDKLPPKNLLITVEYEKAGDGTTKSEVLTGYIGAGNTHIVQLEDQDLRPKSLKIEFNVQAVKNGRDHLSSTINVFDDGVGNLFTTDGQNAGTVDYVTGLLTVKTTQNATFWVPQYDWSPHMSGGGSGSSSRYNISNYFLETLTAYPPTDGTQFMDIRYAIKGIDSSFSEEISLDQYTLNITPTFQEIIVPNSVLFTFGGREYTDRDGALYIDVNPTTGVGSYAGLINYQSGDVSLLNWNTGSGSVIRVTSLLTMLNYQPTMAIDFIVPTAPIRTASLMIRATRDDGVRLEAVANENGEIKSGAIEGEVDIQTGIVSLRFGRLVDAAGNENEPWFNPNGIVDGKVWEPYMVMSQTIKYNAVSTTFSPIAPEVLGIDLVRLPINGKVPIFKRGDLVVMHETFEKLMPVDPPVDFLVSFGIQLITDAWLEDSEGKRLPCEYYENDLIKGEMKLINSDLSGYRQPLTAFAVVEEENNVTDVQITGQLSLRKPVRHRFSRNALLSGMLYIGNMQARFRDLFEQKTWDNKWQDFVDGQPTTWRFNATEYPLVVTNADTVQERWALIFTTETGFRIIGEALGQVGIGSIDSDCKPINPNTGLPYFVLKKEGWGSNGGGIERGNVLRFNTLSANYPVWFVRSVSPSDPTNKGDKFEFRFRGYKQGDK